MSDTTLLPPEDEEEYLLDEEDFDVEDELDKLEQQFDEGTAAWLGDIIDKCYRFIQGFTGVNYYPYQQEVICRVLESVIIGDGEEITVLQSRQSGKS